MAKDTGMTTSERLIRDPRTGEPYKPYPFEPYTAESARAMAFKPMGTGVSIEEQAKLAAAGPRTGYRSIGSTNGRVVSMLEFQGRIYVAAEFGVYRVDGDKLVPLEFVTIPEDSAGTA